MSRGLRILDDELRVMLNHTSSREETCRRLLRVMRTQQPFIDLSLDPQLLLVNHNIRLPIDLRPTSAFHAAHHALSALRILLLFADDYPDLYAATLAVWPDAWRWAAFFHPKFKNVTHSDLASLLPGVNVVIAACAHVEGRQLVLETQDACHLLLDLWLNLFDYIPKISASASPEQLQELDHSLARTICNFVRDIPEKENNPGHPRVIFLVDNALLAAGGNVRKLYRKALSERFIRFTLQKPFPMDAFGRCLADTHEFISILPGRPPRDVVYTLIESWNVSSTLTENFLVPAAFCTWITQFHARRATDSKLLKWAIYAGLIVPLLHLVRLNDDTQKIMTPLILQFMRAQMIHRDFIRSLRRYAGASMVLQCGDGAHIRAFMTEYQENVEELESVEAWSRSIGCDNNQCPAVADDLFSPPLKKCACQTAYYCSVACQRQHWNAGHRLECHVSRSVTSAQFSPSDERYMLAISRKHVNRRRDNILRGVAAVCGAPDFDAVAHAVHVVVDFTQLNDFRVWDTEEPSQPGVSVLRGDKDVDGNLGAAYHLLTVLPRGCDATTDIVGRTTFSDMEKLLGGDIYASLSQQDEQPPEPVSTVEWTDATKASLESGSRERRGSAAARISAMPTAAPKSVRTSLEAAQGEFWHTFITMPAASA